MSLRWWSNPEQDWHWLGGDNPSDDLNDFMPAIIIPREGKYVIVQDGTGEPMHQLPTRFGPFDTLEQAKTAYMIYASTL